MLQDTAGDFVPIKETDQTYVKYLGRALNSIMNVRRCTVNSMILCVTSDPEMEKCVKMRVSILSISRFGALLYFCFFIPEDMFLKKNRNFYVGILK